MKAENSPANARYLAFGFLHFFCSAVGQTFFVSLFVAGVTARLGWADGTFAQLYSGVTLLAAGLLPAVGTQLDRRSVRAVSTATALALAAGLVTLALTQNTLLFAAALLVVRLGGQGVLPLIGSTSVGRFFTERRGRALSLAVIGVSVAEVTVPPAATYAIGAFGHPAVWLAAAGLLLVGFVPAVWGLVRRGDSFQSADAVAAAQAEAAGRLTPAAVAVDATPAAADVAPAVQRSWTRGEALRDSRFWAMVPAYVLTPVAMTGIVFNQSLLADARGFTAAWMAVGLSVFGAARAAMTLGGGALADRLGPARLLRYAYAPSLLGLAILAAVESRWAVPGFFALAGLTAGTESVLWPALWAGRYGPQFLGSIKSAARVIAVLSTAAAPVVFSVGFGASPRLTLLTVVGYGLAAVALLWTAGGRDTT